MKKLIALTLIFIYTVFAMPVLISCGKILDGDTRYEIIAEYIPTSKTLTGVAKVTFQNDTEREISTLKFLLYPNAYRKNAVYKPVSTLYQGVAYYAGESYGEISISSVSGAKNWEVMGEDNNVLYVFLERSLFPNDKVVLDISFITKLANVKHRTGVTEKTVNLGNFYPVLCGIKDDAFLETVYYSVGDPFYSECADYKVDLTLPKDWQVASTGKVLDERTLESQKVYSLSAENVRDFALVLSQNFRVLEEDTNGTLLQYYYYDDKTAKDNFLTIKECFSYFEKSFGGYPYDTYAVVQTGFCMGGMEYPCLSMISDTLIGKEMAYVIVHETAHQWWYGVVGNDQIENDWQDEGLAEYSTVLFFENYEKYGYVRDDMMRSALREYRSYYDVYGSVLGRTDTRMTRHLKEYVNEYEYKCIAYDKSSIMFDTLRKSVGDKKFFSSLQRYYKDHCLKIATIGHLVSAFEKSGTDVHGFFESFLNGKAVL